VGTLRSAVPQTALGFRVHTGWAALVALAGPRTSPRAIARHRIELVDDPYMRFCYHHAAENLALAGREAPHREDVANRRRAVSKGSR